ncbi:hypothetical protein CTI12_AA058740 [Artemisia annua]|uniref:Seven-in-absentia protein TRAF-like domain-containing protein n=1 Tax=Artemisia annua TaxID=35608 RepID=A0A2U1Q385_ARTAN|nr:hypothetical protein CTI12_AA058740 [Artemisia annua]
MGKASRLIGLFSNNRKHSGCRICYILMGSNRCLALEKDNPYYCPYAGSECSIFRNISELVPHLKKDHNVDMHVGNEFNHRYVQLNSHEMENEKRMSLIVSCYGRKFCYHFEAFNMGITPSYIAFLQLIGNETDAKKFLYTLEISGNGRKMTWGGVPKSIRDSTQNVRDNLDGLVIPRNLCLHFLDGNDQQLELELQGRIYRYEF